jgi:predicted anti-sigma-YlaC factor YlaD
MDKECPEFERLRKGLGDWEVHLAQCPSCRDQWAAEEALENLFSEVAPPELSSRFNENLRHRIAKVAEARIRWPLFVMQGYWLAAALISAIILLNMEGLLAGGGLMVMGLILLCFAGPVFLLGRRLGFGLFDLILATLDPRDKPAESYRNGIFS